MTSIKKILHKHFGWFDCVRNYWAKIVNVKNISDVDKSGGIFVDYMIKCEVCGKEEKHRCSACAHTYFDIGDTYVYTSMGSRCFKEKCETTNDFKKFIEKNYVKIIHRKFTKI